MKMPIPRNYDSDVDYSEACEAYQAYLEGKPHPNQPRVVQLNLARKNPDCGMFEENDLTQE